PDKPPVYGITRPAATWNPIRINFQHFFLLVKDAWRTNNVWDKIRIWFMPTGWRPADVAEKYPVPKIEDVYHFEKYDPRASRGLHIWSWVQIVMTLLFISYLFGNIANIGTPDIFIYGGFIFLMVYAYTELMDRNPYALIFETLKNTVGMVILLQEGDWFKASTIIPGIAYFLLAYFVVATFVTSYFVWKHKREDSLSAA
ncbi:MAG: sterol desaturase, partial [Chitinophagaceae bacterium]|nr:sterol desaturase [Chitinophagaceae bacterium]